MNILVSALSAIGGCIVGYLIKHVRDNWYLKKIGDLWMEDVKECDRLQKENKKLIAEKARLADMINDYQRAMAIDRARLIKLKRITDDSDWFDVIGTEDSANIIDFGGFEL